MKQNKTELLQVRMTPEQKDTISKNARIHGISMGEFMRSVALGYKIVPLIDRDSVSDIRREAANLGRLGGLLKGLLTATKNDDAIDKGEIRMVLKQIEAAEREMRKIMITARKKISG